MSVSVDSGGAGVNLPPMDDDLEPRRRPGPLADLAREDLTRLSVDELHDRIAALDAEVARARARLTEADRTRSAADQLFRR